jgi:hypothetical protein
MSKKSAFTILRTNAKRRGIYFDLTPEQFTNFALSNKLFNKDGTRRTNYTVDRIKSELGYTDGNLQVLTTSENSRKKYVDYWYKMYHDLSPEDKLKYEEYRDSLYKEINTRLEKENMEPIEPEIPLDQVPF